MQSMLVADIYALMVRRLSTAAPKLQTQQTRSVGDLPVKPDRCASPDIQWSIAKLPPLHVVLWHDNIVLQLHAYSTCMGSSRIADAANAWKLSCVYSGCSTDCLWYRSS